MNHIPYTKIFFAGCITSILIVAAYWPALSGPMLFDDYHNIVDNSKVAINDLSYDSLKSALLSNKSGMLKRVLPALSFGLNHYMAGGFDNTLVYKATNLLVHLFNSALVFCLVYQLWPRLQRCSEITYHWNGRFGAAVLTTLIWALHPLQLTTVAYIVQRMTSMSASFVLLGLLLFVIGRNRFEQDYKNAIRYMLAGVVGGTVLGLLCKENAALLILYAGVIEFTLFTRSNLKQIQKRRLNWFYGLTLLLPVLLAVIYIFIYPGMLGGYESRPFTLYERVLSQGRILWFYLSMLAIPDITVMGLFHDDMALSIDWLQPISTLISILAWQVLILVSLLMRKKVPVLAFAVFWFLAGHSMESTVLPLELIFEHRNYLPILGPVILLIWAGSTLLSFLPSHRLGQKEGRSLGSLVVMTCVGGLTLILVGSLFFLTQSRANYWRSQQNFIISLVSNHPLSATAQYQYGELLNKQLNKPDEAFPRYLAAAQLNPDEAGFLISASMATPASAVNQLKAKALFKLVDPYSIALLLEHKPISSWGMKSLSVAARCVREQRQDCNVRLEFVRQWLSAAINNRLLGMGDQRLLTRALFEIEMIYGRYQNALATIIKARARDESFMRYYLMHSNVLLSLGDRQQALKVLQKAEAAVTNNQSSAGFINDINKLRSIINRS